MLRSVMLFKRLTNTYGELVALRYAALVEHALDLAFVRQDPRDIPKVDLVPLLEGPRLLVLVDDERLARDHRLQIGTLDLDLVRHRRRDLVEDERRERIRRQHGRNRRDRPRRAVELR